jgi:hypothetical protein
MMRHNSRLLRLLVLLPCSLAAGSVPEALQGDWTLTLTSGRPGWISIQEVNDAPRVSMLVDVGTVEPLQGVESRDGHLHFTLRTQRQGRGGAVLSTDTVDVWAEAGKLRGEILHKPAAGEAHRDAFHGKRLPPLPPAPDLTKVRFGEPVRLFNGKDLSGWRLHLPGKRNGWSVEEGLLVNNTPKTDFSATGAYGNLRTEAVFEDFHLHIEFLIERDRNSGVYLRGMYEAQVVDRDSRMQGIQGAGSIFGRIAPSQNAGKPGGEWQAYDLTLVDRHITVVLNGVKVVDNQPVVGPTGGAIHTDPTAPGPIYLQGDHTSVKFRNIVLRPVVRTP